MANWLWARIVRLVLLINLFLIGGVSFVQANDWELDPVKPALLNGSNYNEYWLQYFLFEDGSYLTTQFSILNFPFNKHKAIMLSTLITPDGKRYIIKNGRGRKEWSFDPARLNISYGRDINHNLQGAAPEYLLNVHNNTGEVQVKFTSSLPTMTHDTFVGKKKKKMEASLYAPYVEANGKWRLGAEVGFDPNGPWNEFGKGEGFGVHVVMDGPIDTLMHDWIRVFGMKGDGGEQLILSSILNADGKRNTQLALHDKGAVTHKFTDSEIKIVEEQKDDKKSFPKVISVKAKTENGKLEGTITFTKKLQHFNLINHVSSLERMVLSAFPTFTLYHYVADYDLTLKSDQGEKKIAGKALSEYTQINSAKTKKKKKRRRR